MEYIYNEERIALLEKINKLQQRVIDLGDINDKQEEELVKLRNALVPISEVCEKLKSEFYTFLDEIKARDMRKYVEEPKWTASYDYSMVEDEDAWLWGGEKPRERGLLTVWVKPFCFTTVYDTLAEEVAELYAEQQERKND